MTSRLVKRKMKLTIVRQSTFCNFLMTVSQSLKLDSHNNTNFNRECSWTFLNVQNVTYWMSGVVVRISLKMDFQQSSPNFWLHILWEWSKIKVVLVFGNGWHLTTRSVLLQLFCCVVFSLFCVFGLLFYWNFLQLSPTNNFCTIFWVYWIQEGFVTLSQLLIAIKWRFLGNLKCVINVFFRFITFFRNKF